MRCPVRVVVGLAARKRNPRSAVGLLWASSARGSGLPAQGVCGLRRDGEEGLLETPLAECVGVMI